MTPPPLVTPQHVALLVLIRQSFLPTLRNTETPKPPCYPLCAFILDRLYDDVNGIDLDLESFMTRLSDLCPPEDADHTVNEDARDIKDKALGVKEFFMNICSKKKPDSIMQLFKDLRRRLCTEREEDDRPFEPEVYAAYPIDRRSPIGVFVRRKWIDFNHASYADLVALTKRCLEWCNAALDESNIMDHDAQPQPSTSKSTLNQSNQNSRVAAFDEYQRSRVNGHSFRAHQALHRFFDYRFAEVRERGHLQHALINLAGLHADEGGFEQARMALMEAIKLARQQNDKSTITSCLALMRRIDLQDPDHRISEAALDPPEPSALMGSQDHLWRAKEAVRLGNPTNVALASLYRAKASLVPETVGFRFDRFKVRWDAVSGELWGLLGSKAIADVHRNLALDPDVDLGIERSQQGSLCSTLAAKAKELAHCGEYAEALLLLLSHVSPKHQLPKSDMNILQAAVYDVLRTEALRENFNSALDHLDSLDAGRARFKSPDAATDVERRVHALLEQAQNLKNVGNHAAALHEVLEAMSLSDMHDPPDQDLNHNAAPSHGRTLPRLFLHAQVLLAEIELAYEASYKARKLLEDIESRVRKLLDPALLADWAWVLGKALLAEQAAASKQDSRAGDALGQRAVDHLILAVQKYGSIRFRSRHISALGDLAMAYNTMGLLDQRNEVLREWKTARNEQPQRQSEEAFLQSVGRIQKWMVAQDVQLCVETPTKVPDGLQTERALAEWDGPTFGGQEL